MRRDGEHISLLGLKWTLAMGIFEPLIEHSDGKPPEHPLDMVAPMLVLLLAVVLLAVALLWGG